MKSKMTWWCTGSEVKMDRLVVDHGKATLTQTTAGYTTRVLHNSTSEQMPQASTV